MLVKAVTSRFGSFSHTHADAPVRERPDTRPDPVPAPAPLYPPDVEPRPGWERNPGKEREGKPAEYPDFELEPCFA